MAAVDGKAFEGADLRNRVNEPFIRRSLAGLLGSLTEPTGTAATRNVKHAADIIAQIAAPYSTSRTTTWR
jgi:hypothetical protein